MLYRCVCVARYGCPPTKWPRKQTLSLIRSTPWSVDYLLTGQWVVTENTRHSAIVGQSCSSIADGGTTMTDNGWMSGVCCGFFVGFPEAHILFVTVDLHSLLLTTPRFHNLFFISSKIPGIIRTTFSQSVSGTLVILWKSGTLSLADWLTAWLTHWLAGWLTGWLIAGWLAAWLAVWLTRWLAGWPAVWLTHWLAGWLAGWLTSWLTHHLADSLIGWLDVTFYHH